MTTNENYSAAPAPAVEAKATLTWAQREMRTLLAQHSLHAWRFEWDTARNRGGRCQYGARLITMSRYLVPAMTQTAARNVMLHEIAHALVGPGHGHDRIWVRQARAIGCTGDRCHQEATVKGRYRATCPDCGKEWDAHQMGAAMKAGRSRCVCYKINRNKGKLTWRDTGRVGYRAG